LPDQLKELGAVAVLLIEARDKLEVLDIADLGAEELHSEISRAHAHCNELQKREQQAKPRGRRARSG
jgi:hypothetical protein